MTTELDEAKVHAAFETWAHAHGYTLAANADGYMWQGTQKAWEIFLAGYSQDHAERQALENDLDISRGTVAILKAQRTVLEARIKAMQSGEPVAWRVIFKDGIISEWCNGSPDEDELQHRHETGCQVEFAYARPPVPQAAAQVPDEIQTWIYGDPHPFDYVQGWNACRAAMLAAAPQPAQEVKPCE